MSSKMTSFLAAHYPNTYMEQLCKSLHSDLELNTICVSWFRQATKHCTDLINNVKAPTTFFWTTVKNFIFPDRSAELITQKITISTHPNRLSLQDCQSLFLDIVSDYIVRAPRYGAESKTNVMLWQVLYSLMGIMALGSLLVAVIFIFNKYGQPKAKTNLLEQFFKPEKRMQVLSKRSLRLAKAELRNIHMKPVSKVEDIVPGDGSDVLALKIGTKYEFMDAIVMGNLHTVGKLHRLYDQYNKTKADFKIESLNKAMKFVDNNCKRIHLLVMFEPDVIYEEEDRKPKSNSPKAKNVTPPSPTGKCSTLTSKAMLNARLEGGEGFSYKAATGIASVSPRANSPKSLNSPKQATTPRSSGVPSSAIPRNVCKRFPMSRKSK